VSVKRLRLMAAVPWSEVAVSQMESSEKSSLRIIDPIPGLISGVDVRVGKVFSVGVGVGGNQIMVAVGGGVSDGRGVSVAGIVPDGAHDVERRNPKKRKEMIKRFME